MFAGKIFSGGKDVIILKGLSGSLYNYGFLEWKIILEFYSCQSKLSD